jgi:hypothetical protein
MKEAGNRSGLLLLVVVLFGLLLLLLLLRPADLWRRLQHRRPSNPGGSLTGVTKVNAAAGLTA